MPLLAAIVPGFALVAVPVLILMVVWTGVTMWRLVFPEEDLPFEREAIRAKARERGEAVPVRLADILEDQRRHPVWPVMPRHQRVEADAGEDARGPLQEDLWRRRN